MHRIWWPIQNIIRRGMLDKCKSEIFRNAIASQTSVDYQEALLNTIRGAEWDASVLELLGQCMPETWNAAILDRAIKNETVISLFPFRVRSRLSTTVKRSVFGAIAHLLHIVITNVSVSYDRNNVFNLAHDLRSCDTLTKKIFLSILGFSNFTSKIMRT